MSLYAQYIAEKTNKFILETDYGFATYSFPDATTVYLEDIFVVKDCRQQGVATELVDEITEIARYQGCTRLLGSVIPSTKGSTESLKVFLRMGAKIESATTDFIVISKGI